jgi:hypothetical protein
MAAAATASETTASSDQVNFRTAIVFGVLADGGQKAAASEQTCLWDFRPTDTLSVVVYGVDGRNVDVDETDAYRYRLASGTAIHVLADATSGFGIGETGLRTALTDIDVEGNVVPLAPATVAKLVAKAQERFATMLPELQKRVVVTDFDNGFEPRWWLFVTYSSTLGYDCDVCGDTCDGPWRWNRQAPAPCDVCAACVQLLTAADRATYTQRAADVAVVVTDGAPDLVETDVETETNSAVDDDDDDEYDYDDEEAGEDGEGTDSETGGDAA